MGGLRRHWSVVQEVLRLGNLVEQALKMCIDNVGRFNLQEMTTVGHDFNDGTGRPLSDLIQPGRGLVFTG